MNKGEETMVRHRNDNNVYYDDDEYSEHLEVQMNDVGTPFLELIWLGF
jgi:hypothetical protein